MHFLAGFAFVGCLLLVFPGILWAQPAAEAERTLVVGVYHNPPKLRAAEDGSPSGILGELLVEIARREGWQLQAVSCDWIYCLRFLLEGEIDLLPDMAYTEQRAESFSFHQVPALYSWSQLYGEGGVLVTDITDLANQRIAVLSGSVQQSYLEQQLQQHGLVAELVPTESLAEGFALLQAGRVGLVAANHYFGQQLAGRHQLQASPWLFQPSQLFYASRHGQQLDLLQQIDTYLQRWQQQPDSPYYQILSRWGAAELESSSMQQHYRNLLLLMVSLLLVVFGGALVLRWQVKEKTRHLQASEARLNTILDTVDAYIYIKDKKLCYQYVNKKVAELFQCTADEATGHNDFAFFDHATAQQLQANDRDVLDRGERKVREEENTSIDGRLTRHFLSVKIPLCKPDGEVYALCGISTDVTEHRQQQQAIHQLAFYDALTGLPNRRLLLDRLQQAFALHQRQQQQGALMFIDLDHFKDLNDTLGHAVGDELLVDISNRLQQGIRSCDTLARLGGDEFVLLLQELPDDEQRAWQRVQVIAEKVLQLVNQPVQLQQQPYQLSASIGVAMLSDGDSVDVLMQRADMAMYDAKGRGRNRVRFFNQHMQVEVTERTVLTNRLRQAMEKEELYLAYQPQFDRRQGITGAEVLLRWQHPDHGHYAPADFIPIAEATGLILPIGQWVLQQSCRLLADWAKEPGCQHWQLAVNISPRQLHDAHFVEQLTAILQQTEAPAERLLLEITESQLLEDTELALKHIHQLAAMGIRFALDDFGTGYSSLQYLKTLPLKQLKIDASFVRDLLQDSSDEAIVRTILALGQSLELEVIAEGVETAAQFKALYQIGCRQFQGYYLARPGTLEQLYQHSPSHPG
ncbi:EAL domain-containing protein [Alkalimonas amylolytica]|uniref:cyclic-guanylate-specific phosphodiesterase n=1 Tax=Alkalimonas amylolytica TaxID=152573 RepID=A0A1H4CLU2_ALKAM|nr:EAL domain-containing protein [Alkalimonas amylolytica]SEA61032.1 periplasmic sensor diguanylate cyclase/phosphodiesterase [Alkalimonas amylolytica]